GPLIDELDGQPFVEERQLTQAGLERVVIESDVMKNLPVRLERDARAGAFRQAHFLDFSNWLAALVLLGIRPAASPYLGLDPLTQGSNGFGADAVQARGNLISILVELGAGADGRHDDFQRRPLGFGMLVHGDSAAVVVHAQAAIDVDLHEDVPAVAGQRFIDAVIHQFVNEVVQAAGRNISDIHAGTLPNVGGIAKYLHIIRAILIG